MTISVYGENSEQAAQAVVDEINRLDRLLSVSSAEGDITAVNSGGTLLSQETAALVSRSIEISEQTDGAFDITVQPLMELWGFRRGELHVPSKDELSAALALCGSEKMILSENELILSAGQKIDLGGIAKGYAADRVNAVLSENGITSAVANLGGSILCVGSSSDGKPWSVGIETPYGDGSYLGVLSVSDCTVVTSGGYQRYYDSEDGTRYHHILDPKTGVPADSGIASVTIVSSDGTLADGLSTALFVMGMEKSAQLWQNNPDAFQFVIADNDGRVYITEGIENCFSSERNFSVIRL